MSGTPTANPYDQPSTPIADGDMADLTVDESGDGAEDARFIGLGKYEWDSLFVHAAITPPGGWRVMDRQQQTVGYLMGNMPWRDHWGKPEFRSSVR